MVARWSPLSRRVLNPVHQRTHPGHPPGCETHPPLPAEWRPASGRRLRNRVDTGAGSPAGPMMRAIDTPRAIANPVRER